MDKNVRNLLITGVVSCIVGIIMGIGVVAPSVEQPVGVGEYQMVINTDTPETMELCIDWTMKLETELAECATQRDLWKNGFYKALKVSKDAQAQTVQAMGLIDKCIAELEGGNQ